MRILIFGATGMVGQGALRECLLDEGVSEVVAIVRRPTGRSHPKLREIVQTDLTWFDTTTVEVIRGIDACLFCLGISSAGLGEAGYTRITYDMPLAAAQALLQASPGAVFIHVSGAGADSSETSRTMWQRVKGRAENALLRLPFKAVYILRPGGIRPMHGITSRTALYRILYAATAPLWPWLERRFPNHVTSTERIGQAMLMLARRGGPSRILECGEINRLAEQGRDLR